jgi:hypothetical protein
MKKKHLFIILIFLFNLFLVDHASAEELQKIEEDNYFICDYQKINSKHAEWMFNNANYFFSHKKVAKLIEKEKTELKISGIYLSFVDYRADGCVIEDVLYYSKKNIPITIAFVSILSLFLLYSLYINTKRIRKKKKITKKTFDLFLRSCMLFTLFFLLVISAKGANYAFLLVSPWIFLIIVASIAMLFFSFEIIRGNRKKLIFSYLLIFAILFLSIYLYSGILFVTQLAVISLGVLVISFTPYMLKFLKEI